ncbi:unnamed protein product [Meloidogyne enterolobii]|uniref:Uncharacterized protein n=1 Tax=Meloidogyne enterolobii TaxID=390850 RepID=A0ACB1B1M6_MELEN
MKNYFIKMLQQQQQVLQQTNFYFNALESFISPLKQQWERILVFFFKCFKCQQTFTSPNDEQSLGICC